MSISPKTLRARQLNLEGLEERLNLSSYVYNGDLYVVGSNYNDTVTVNYETWYGTGYYKVTENGVNSWHYASSVSGGDVYFYGYAGNDYFNNNTGLRTTAYGHAGNDTLLGSYNNDYLDGGDDTDYLYGYGGTDTLVAGYDYSYNYLSGGDGTDYLYGGYGNDTLVAGYDYSTNYLYGSYGDDTLYGGYGTDWMYGGFGDDYLYGNDGVDVLYGESGDDRLYGQGDYDYLYGGDGNDWLEAGSASEYADGGAGMDWNAHVWAIDGATAGDVKQQGAPTCSFLASLSSAAMRGYNLANYISYAGNHQYLVWLHNGSAWQQVSVTFDGSTTWTDPGSMAEGESWTILFQRAYIKMLGNDGSSWPYTALTALTGQATTSIHRTLWDGDFNTIKSSLAAGKNVVTATYYSNPNKDPLLVGNHAYTVVSTWESGADKWVLVRNPWAVDGGSTTYGDPSDGYIWLTWSQFKANMQGIWIN